MAVSIRIAGAAFTKSVSQIAPFTESATALMFFGGSAAASRVNLIDGSLATVLGAPTYGDGYAGVGGIAGFDTGKLGTNPFTHCIVTTIGTGNGIYMGNWKVGATANAIGRFNTLVYPFVSGSTRGAGTAYPSATGFNFLAVSHDGATAKIHKALAGVLTTVSAAYAASPAATSLRVGGLVESGTTVNDVAAAMSFNRVLSEAEVLVVHNYLKGMVARRGIVVV